MLEIYNVRCTCVVFAMDESGTRSCIVMRRLVDYNLG